VRCDAGVFLVSFYFWHFRSINIREIAYNSQTTHILRFRHEFNEFVERDKPNKIKIKMEVSQSVCTVKELAFMSVARKGLVDRVKKFIAKGVKANAKDEVCAALVVIVNGFCCFVDCADCFLKKGLCDVNLVT